MGEGTSGELGLRTTHPDHDVVLRTFSFRNLGAGDVGKQGQQVVQLGVVVIGHFQQFVGAGLELGHFGLGIFSLLLLAFLHQLADGGRRLFLLCEHGVAAGLEGFTVVVQDDDFVHDVPGIEVFNGKSPDYKIRRLT